jgi:hypothetical protein
LVSKLTCASAGRANKASRSVKAASKATAVATASVALPVRNNSLVNIDFNTSI